jgi:hypothetical protein
MRLSINAISEFKNIYQAKFGIELTDDEANLKGLELLELFRCIYRKIPIENAQILNAYENDNRSS